MDAGDDGLARVLQSITQTVTRAFIEAEAGKLFMLHAGACANPDTGATVAYVARGGMGKTTLTRLLGMELGYITDETVGIRPDLIIAPYPKPLSVRPEGGHGPKIETSPDDLGLVNAPPSPRLARIVLLHRDQDHTGAPQLTELSLAEAIVDLAPESSSLSSLPRPLHLVADVIERTGPVLRCDYAEASELVPLLAELVS